MKSIKEINVTGKRVLVRCDFNISLNENGELSGDLRIKQALPTITYLIEQGAKIILLSHFEEPKEVRSIENRKDEKLKDGSIYPVKKCLENLLNKEIIFTEDCLGEKVEEEIEKMKEGGVLLLENVRMYKEEKENSLLFAEKLSLLADIFVNDAFSVSHREHASVTKIPSFLPSYSGLLMEKEISVLSNIQKNPKRPLVAIIGGAKIESKIEGVRYFLENADHVLLGGKIANMVLIVRKIASNLSWPEKKIVDIVESMDYTSPKLHIPVDVIASEDNTGEKETREIAPGKVEKNEDIFDIGEETIKLYGEIIKEAGTIIWAGPLGFFEKKAFEKGTKRVGEEVISNEKALKVVGGGDTSNALFQLGVLDKINLVSYGGGAMLAYLKNEELPGIKALEK
jgi:phosphoglycerate kinase